MADDVYSQLEEMHKLIEELRAKAAMLEGELVKLRESISAHYSKIFQPIEGGRR